MYKDTYVLSALREKEGKRKNQGTRTRKVRGSVRPMGSYEPVA